MTGGDPACDILDVFPWVFRSRWGDMECPAFEIRGHAGPPAKYDGVALGRGRRPCDWNRSRSKGKCGRDRGAAAGPRALRFLGVGNDENDPVRRTCRILQTPNTGRRRQTTALADFPAQCVARQLDAKPINAARSKIPATMGNGGIEGGSFGRYDAHPARWSIAVPCGVDILARLAAVQPPHILTALS